MKIEPKRQPQIMNININNEVTKQCKQLEKQKAYPGKSLGYAQGNPTSPTNSQRKLSSARKLHSLNLRGENLHESDTLWAPSGPVWIFY